MSLITKNQANQIAKRAAVTAVTSLVPGGTGRAVATAAQILPQVIKTAAQVARSVKTSNIRGQVVRSSAVRPPVSIGYKMSVKNTSTPISGHGQFATLVSNKTAGNFQADKFTINPGNSYLFPWLHDIAIKWDFYKFNYLAVHYVPIVSTATNGAVMLGIDYDPTDDTPKNVRGMSLLTGANVSPTYQKQTLVIFDNRRTLTRGRGKKSKRVTNPNYKPMTKELSVCQTLPKEKDPKLYYAGRVFVASDAITNANTKLGYLWVTYSVTFSGQTPDAADLVNAEGVSPGENQGDQTGNADDGIGNNPAFNPRLDPGS